MKEKKYGKGSRKCQKCGKRNGLIRKYGFCYCRQCFREMAQKLGFKKYS